VISKAKHYGNVADNKQLIVMGLIGRSRCLIFMPIPLGIILTQLSSAANQPPLLIIDEVPNLELIAPFKKRAALWVISMLRFALTLSIVFGVGGAALVATILMTLLHVAVDTVMPNRPTTATTEDAGRALEKESLISPSGKGADNTVIEMSPVKSIPTVGDAVAPSALLKAPAVVVPVAAPSAPLSAPAVVPAAEAEAKQAAPADRPDVTAYEPR